MRKILDWDGTVKLNILPLFLPDAKYNQTLNTQVTFADHQYSDDNNFSEPSTMNKHIRFSKKGYGARTSSNARSLSFEWLGNYSISSEEPQHPCDGRLFIPVLAKLRFQSRKL